MSVVGLIPFSDAGGYLASAHDYFKDGTIDAWAMRRPWAAAARTALLAAGGLSYTNMMLIQGLLLALSVAFGAREIRAWRGTWAAIVYSGVMFIVCRSFLISPLTEGIGLIWACLAIPFFIRAIRTASLSCALLGFSFMTVSLMVRMGAMFLIPGLMLWIIWQFGKSWRGRFAVALAAACIVGAAASGNFVINKLYAATEAAPGSNFWYTLCGLSLGPGSIWSDCPKKYSAELQSLPPSVSEETFVHQKAISNISQNPFPFFMGLVARAKGFVRTNVLLTGYSEIQPPKWFRPFWFLALAATGLAGLAWKQRDKNEFVFWSLVCLGSVASGAVVWDDDGRRVMSSCFPLFATLVASGFWEGKRLLIRREPANRRLVLIGWFILAAGVLGVVCGPITFAKIRAGGNSERPHAEPNVFSVYGGDQSTGILVVADEDALPTEVPAIHYSDFERLVDRSGIEKFYHGLVHPKSPTVPFGFIEAPLLEKDRSGAVLFLVPAKVMLQKQVRGWRFGTKSWQSRPGEQEYWYLVTTADPIEP
jgi:hypothetical protein